MAFFAVSTGDSISKHNAPPINFRWFSVGYTMRDIRYKWNKGPNSVGVSNEVSLPQFKVLGHRQRAMEISLTTGKYIRLGANVIGILSYRSIDADRTVRDRYERQMVVDDTRPPSLSFRSLLKLPGKRIRFCSVNN